MYTLKIKYAMALLFAVSVAAALFIFNACKKDAIVETSEQTFEIIQPFKNESLKVHPEHPVYDASKSGSDYFSGPCYGTSSVKVTYNAVGVPTAATIYLNSCLTADFISIGCGGLKAILGKIGSPVPIVDVLSIIDSTVCKKIIDALLLTKCPCTGVIIQVSLALGVESVTCQPASGCDPCNTGGGCSFTAVPDNVLSLFSLQEASKFISTEIHQNGVDIQKLYIDHANEIEAVFNSDLPEYKNAQKALDDFVAVNAELLENGFSAHSDLNVESQHIAAADKLLTELAVAVQSPKLKSTILQVKGVLPVLKGKQVKAALKAFDQQKLQLTK